MGERGVESPWLLSYIAVLLLTHVWTHVLSAFIATPGFSESLLASTGHLSLFRLWAP